MTLSGLIIYDVSVTGDVGAVACRHGGNSMVVVLWAYLAHMKAFKGIVPMFFEPFN